MSESVDNNTFILRYSYDHVHYIDQVAGDWDKCYGTAYHVVLMDNGRRQTLTLRVEQN